MVNGELQPLLWDIAGSAGADAIDSSNIFPARGKPGTQPTASKTHMRYRRLVCQQSKDALLGLCGSERRELQPRLPGHPDSDLGPGPRERRRRTLAQRLSRQRDRLILLGRITSAEYFLIRLAMRRFDDIAVNFAGRWVIPIFQSIGERHDP